MIYKIDNKYYVKVGNDFVEVELVYSKNDIDLKPTNNKLENNNKVKYEEINFLSNKAKLLEEHNRIADHFDSSKMNKQESRYNKYSK